MTRGALVVALLALVAAGCGEGRPPNVLLIVLDTARGDRCSVNGYPSPTTPEMERIARSGVTYKNAWSPSGWTGPAHASLFTGLLPERHGFHRSNRHFLLPESRTLAERFRDAGYRTAAFVNNDTVCPENGFGQGFDLFRALYLEEDRDYPWAPETHRMAMEWIRADPDEPFFLFINDMEPHFRYEPPEDVASRFIPTGTSGESVWRARNLPADALFEHNAGVRKIPPKTLRALSALYDAEIATVDSAVGALFDELSREKRLEDTVVVITSDHGENLGEHDYVDHMFGAHRTLRHVPLVFRYPPRFTPGDRVDDTVRLEDLAPTLLEVCGLDVPPGLDGRSLLDDLEGRIARGHVDSPRQLLDRRLPQLPIVQDESRLRADVRAVFDGRYHLLSYSDGREELFDVLADPGEERNLSRERVASPAD